MAVSAGVLAASCLQPALHSRRVTLLSEMAALMLLGAGDQRVPHSQGREWVAALQSQPEPPPVVALADPARLPR